MKTTLYVYAVRFSITIAIISVFYSCQKKDLTPLRDEVNESSKTRSPREPANPNPPSSQARVLISSAFDNSGRLEVAVWAESADGNHPHAEVAVDPGFVLIGGGARVSNFSNTSFGVNALLTAAYPKDDGTFSTYAADSKDHIQSYSHRLWVYAIGMRMYDASMIPLDASYVKTYMNISKTVSSSSQFPTATACPPSGYTTLSGGAKINWSGEGNLLVQSGWPSSYPCLFAKGKDHKKVSPATIESYVVSISNTIPEFGPLEFASHQGGHSSNPYQQESITLQATHPFTGNYLVAGVGARTDYIGWGRLLFEMYPVNATSIKVSDKDHIDPDQGTLYAWISMIRKQ